MCFCSARQAPGVAVWKWRAPMLRTQQFSYDVTPSGLLSEADVRRIVREEIDRAATAEPGAPQTLLRNEYVYESGGT